MPPVTRAPVSSVLILKSDRLYGDTLRRSTLRAFRRVSVRVVTTVAAAELELRNEPADMLVTGIAGGLEGDVLELIARCAEGSPRSPRVLVVTATREYRVLAGLRGLGVDGVFDSAGEPPERIVTALRATGSGARYWSSTILDLMQRDGSATYALFRVLTAFEQLVLSVIGDGSDDVIAARELGVRPATVSTVRRDLHRKLGVQHRGELVRIAAQHGFVRFTPSGVVRPGFALLAAAYNARRLKRPVPAARFTESARAFAAVAA